MDWIIYALKASGIVLSAHFGIYGLLYDFRDAETSRVTPEGRRALLGILVGAVISLGSMAFEEIAAARQFSLQLAHANQTLDGIEELLGTSSETLKQTAVIVQNTERSIESLAVVTANSEETLGSLGQALDGIKATTDGLGRVIGAIVPYEASLVFSISNSSSLLEKLASVDQNPTAAFRAFAKEGCIFSVHPVTQALELSIDLRETHSGDANCFLEFFSQTLGLSLPHSNVVFFHDDTIEGTDARFRVHGKHAFAHSTQSTLAVRYLVEQDVWELELDDIPIRFRTQSILSQIDYLGLNMQVIETAQDVLGTNNGSLEFLSMDVDTHDGRGFAMAFEEGTTIESETVVFTEFKFPNSQVELERVFGSER